MSSSQELTRERNHSDLNRRSNSTDVVKSINKRDLNHVINMKDVNLDNSSEKKGKISSRSYDISERSELRSEYKETLSKEDTITKQLLKPMEITTSSKNSNKNKNNKSSKKKVQFDDTSLSASYNLGLSSEIPKKAMNIKDVKDKDNLSQSLSVSKDKYSF